ISVIIMVFVGSLYEAKIVWELGDIGVGSMAWINIIAILLLSPKVFKIMKSYDKQQKQGIEPVFNPKEFGISNADFWEEKSDD
ncbi:MAG: alanine:cation symporter family protein, partial [Bacteroidales bacterium]|nr:alanine:cation symporter family protein [Bacteroidales bacterium]